MLRAALLVELLAVVCQGTTLVYQACSSAAQELARFKLDASAFNTAVTTDYAKAREIYVHGLNVCAGPRPAWTAACPPRTLQSLNTEFTDDPYSGAHLSFYGRRDAWDELILSSLNGTDGMEAKNDVFRGMVAKKSVLGLAVMSTLQHLEQARVLSTNASTSLEAIQALDASWAMYFGQDGTSMPSEVAGKRDNDFPGGLQVSSLMPALYLRARAALEKDPVETAVVEDIIREVERCIMVTFVRATIKYSHKTQALIGSGSFSEKYFSEGYAYWRPVAPLVAVRNLSAATTIEHLFFWQLEETTLDPAMHCKIKKSLEDAYPSLDLDCGIIGDWKDYADLQCGSSACQSPNATRFRDVAELVPPGEDLSSSCDMEVELAIFCDVGEEALGSTCSKCRAGWYNPQSASNCMPCPPGFFSAQPGSFECQLCPEGTFAAGDVFAGNTQCTPCLPGTSAQAPGATKCLECLEGTFSTQSGSSICSKCGYGEHQSQRGMENCSSCPGGLSTEERGSIGPELCKCSMGTYRLDNESDVCATCPEGLTCPFGSVHAPGAEVRPLLLPGYWSSVLEPLATFVCANQELCIGGTPGQASCAAHLTGRACAKCEEPYVLSGRQCIQCDGFHSSGVQFIFVAVALVCGAALFTLLNTDASVLRWQHWKTGCGATLFVLLNHYQLMQMLRVTESHMPPETIDVLNVFTFVNADLELFSASCTGASGKMTKLTLSSAMPLVALAAFMAAWGITQLAATVAKFPGLAMAQNDTWNQFCTIIFSFFTAISAAAFDITNCAPNPSGKDTLSSDKGVLCYEGEWWSMLVIGILAIACWCCGFGALFSWVLYVGPRRILEAESFRRKWKFLFIKWRTGCQWFGMAVMAKGVVMMFGFIIMGDMLGKAYWAMFTLSMYVVLVGVFLPWRILQISVSDMVSHVTLIMLWALTTWFLPRTRSTDAFVTDLSKTLPFVCPALALVAAAVMIYKQRSASHLAKRAMAARRITERLVAASSTDAEMLQAIMGQLTDYDFHAAKIVASLLPEAQVQDEAKAKGFVADAQIAGETEWTGQKDFDGKSVEICMV